MINLDLGLKTWLLQCKSKFGPNITISNLPPINKDRSLFFLEYFRNGVLWGSLCASTDSCYLLTIKFHNSVRSVLYFIFTDKDTEAEIKEID